MLKVFFDVDGVLIDGWHDDPLSRNPWDADIERDLGIDRKAFQARFFGSGPGLQGSLMQACLKGERDLKDALADILPSVGYRGPVTAFVAYWFEKDSNINPEVLDVAKRLGRHAQIELYLVTGQEHYRARYLWNDLGFGEHFQDILYSAKLGHLKTTSDFFAAVNRDLTIPPSERPLLFDDQEDVVRLAREAGWDACVFNRIEDLVTHPRLRSLLKG